MTATAPNPPASIDHVLDLLAKGTTTIRTAELTGWPRSQIVALINGQRGWLVDPTRDVVIQPGRRTNTLEPPTQADRKPPADHRPPTSRPGIVVPVHEIEPHPRNIRGQLGDLGELADSIRQHGVLQPLLVEPHPGRPRGYRLLAGHRRYAAAQLAGLDMVPVVVRAEAGVDTAIELMLIENCHRADLSAMEKAEAFGQLRDLGRSQTQIAQRTGFSQATVGHFLTLLDLDDRSQEKVRAGELKVGDAIAGVRKARAETRKREGSRRDFSWEPDHLTPEHRQAREAQRFCEKRGHTMRRRIGKVACGECWESAIRLDERRTLEAEERE